MCIDIINNNNLSIKFIKNTFNSKFKLIAGNEYYEGNEKNMYDEFIKLNELSLIRITNKITNCILNYY